MTSTTEFWNRSLGEAQECLAAFLADSQNITLCEKFSELMFATVQRKGNFFACGNGGSHCDAMHLAEELTGRYRQERPPLGALALGDPSHVTCVSNDYGFEHIFSRQLRGLGREGDLVVGLSTSGNSKNVISAFEAAKEMGISTVALLGRDGGKMKSLADLSILVPGTTSDRIQEIHIKIIHIVIETLERRLFPKNYE